MKGVGQVHESYGCLMVASSGVCMIVEGCKRLARRISESSGILLKGAGVC